MKRNLCATGCGKGTEATLCTGCVGEVVTNLRKLATGGVLRIRVHQKLIHTPSVRDKETGDVVTPGSTKVVQEFRTDSRPSLYECLIDTLVRKDHTGGQSIGAVSGAPSYELTFHKKAGELKDVIDSEVATWARDVAALNGRELTATTVRGAAAWLAKEPKLLAAHPDAGRLHSTMRKLVRSVERVIDRDPDNVYLGQCGTLDTDGVTCPTDLYVPPGQPVIQCPACKYIWDVRLRREVLLDNVDDQLAAPPDISKALSRLGKPVTVNAIYGYIHRGKLDPHPAHPLDPRGRTRYRVGDVRAILNTLNQEEAS